MRKTLKKKEKKKELLNKRKEGEDLRRKRCRERNCHRFGESFWPIFRVESNQPIDRSHVLVTMFPRCRHLKLHRARQWDGSDPEDTGLSSDGCWISCEIRIFLFFEIDVSNGGKKLIAQNWFQLNNSWKIYVIINLCLLYNFNIEFGGRNRSNVVLEINL